MKRNNKCKMIMLLIGMLLIGTMSACGSSEPCNSCGSTPTKGYKNEYTSKNEYYCSDCSSDCAFCGERASKHYTSMMGMMIFACDSCYKDVQDLNGQ